MNYENKYLYLLAQLRWLGNDIFHWKNAFEISNNVEAAELMKAFQEKIGQIDYNATGDDICLDSCKNMYFCTLPKDHDGKHSENGLLSWD